ncbi:hypothetical protein [Mesorhizobium sp. 1M-11]|uniref:hypothetical protein n=1 Tax=Mesorhizobium sp. 1M-11 TaxID=1529006 RepID=UPI0006C7556C|nr:hypothetical protein [Mesorhizobium sp. 1M-11]
MTTFRLLRRIVLACFGLALVAIMSMAGLLAFPQPLYAYHVGQGRLHLYSDRPFNELAGRAVLADVEGRLAKAPAGFRDDVGVYRIFVTNEEWRRRLVFLWNGGAAGVNYAPVGGVFIRQSDIDHNQVLKADATPVPEPRTLACYAGHEIGHSLISNHIGAIANWRLPAWQREGMADYIAMGGIVDVDALARARRSGEVDLDPKRSGNYALYRLLVAFLLDKEHWSPDELLASGMTLTEAEKRLDLSLPSGP